MAGLAVLYKRTGNIAAVGSFVYKFFRPILSTSEGGGETCNSENKKNK